MPRLRYLKNYEQITEISSNDETSVQMFPTIEELQYEGRFCSENIGGGGQSWLSNSTIISSLPDDKIKQAISYHRQMAHLLEAELNGRIKGNRILRMVDTSFGRINGDDRYEVLPDRRRERRTKKDIFKGLGLSSKLKKELTKCLEEYMIANLNVT